MKCASAESRACNARTPVVGARVMSQKACGAFIATMQVFLAKALPFAQLLENLARLFKLLGSMCNRSCIGPITRALLSLMSLLASFTSDGVLRMSRRSAC